MGSDGGGSQSSTSYNNAIQPELMPYAMRMLGSASDMVYKNPIQQYTGQMTAGFSPLQQQAMGNLQQMQPSAYLNQGANLAGMAGTNQFTGANVNQYMSPYINDVIRNQQQGAIRNYSTQLPTMAAGATRAGALGGSRSAIMESEAQSNLQNQLQGIQSSGLQNAYQNAQQQFNTANQNQLAAANALGNFGQQQYAQSAGINQALMNAGALQQSQEQNALNASYQKFMNAQMEPYQRLNFMSSLIRGVPVQSMGQTMYTPPPSSASQLLGLGMGAYGLNQAFGQQKNAREGGSTEDIKGYAGGGIVSLASGGSTTEKMGAINARMEQLKRANPSMPMNQVNAQIQQETQAIPNSIPWQNAAALLAYNKTHPAVVAPPPPDTVVVQMAKQIAQQDQAKKAAEAQKAMMAQQGLAGLPTPNVGQNYTPNGITEQPQEEQGGPQVNAAEGGGIADLQADVGGHYASGGIVAFNGEDGSEVEGEPVDERTAMMNRLVNAAVPGLQVQDIMSAPQASMAPRPAILTSAADRTATPGSTSILQSRDAANATSANLGPRAAAPSPLDQRPLGPLNQNAAFNRAAPTLANTIPTATAMAAPAAATRYDDSRYQAAAAASQKQPASGIAALRPATKATAIPEVEDTRLTKEQYFDEYKKLQEKSGLNKATSDLSKFLDNEQVNAAQEAKTDRALALAQFGFDIASTGGSLARGIAAGGKGYTSALAGINKEQRATERSLAKSRLDLAQSLAKDDMSAWSKGLDNYREDSKNLETLKAQRQQLVESQRHNVETEAAQREANANTRAYYDYLKSVSGVKTNATLEKYKNLFGAAIDKYAATNDPKDRAAADHYQQVIQTLVDPTQTKAPAAISAALAKDKGVEMAQLMLFSAQQSGDPDEVAKAQAQLDMAKQQALTTAGFTQQLGNASGTGVNLVNGIGGGAKFLGFE